MFIDLHLISLFAGVGRGVLPNSFRVLCASFFERARRASSHARGQHPRGTRGRQPPATARARGQAAEGERPVARCGAHERDDGGRGAVAHDRRRCAAARGGARPAEGRDKGAEQGRSRLREVPCCGFRGGRERLPSLRARLAPRAASPRAGPACSAPRRLAAASAPLREARAGAQPQPL